MRARNNVSQIWFASDSNNLEMKSFPSKNSPKCQIQYNSNHVQYYGEMIHINQFPLIIPGKDRLIKFSLYKIKCVCYHLKVTNYQIRTEKNTLQSNKRKTNTKTIQ